jgi:hypothetical protein
VYRTISQDRLPDVCHVNSDLLVMNTVDDIQVSHYDGWPGASSKLASRSKFPSQPTPIMQLAGDAAVGTTPFSPERSHAATVPCAQNSSSLYSQSNQAVHSTNILVCNWLRTARRFLMRGA